jgi:hypothetical protein
MALRGDYWVKRIITSSFWMEEMKAEYQYALLVYTDPEQVERYVINTARSIVQKTRSEASVEAILWPESLSLEDQARLGLLEEDYNMLGRRNFAKFWQVPEGLVQRVFAPHTLPNMLKKVA